MKVRNCLVFLVLLLSVTAVHSQTAVEYFNQGHAYEQKKDLNNAVIAYTSAIRLNPSYEEAIHNRGNIYWSQEKYALAIADLNRAVQLAPNEAAAFADRGNLVLDSIDWNTARSEYDAAYADLQKALRLDPNNAAAKSGLAGADAVRLNVKADAEFAKSKYADAVKFYTDALKRQPGNLYALFGRGRAYLSDDKNDLAIADYDAYIKLKTNEPAAYSNRGLAKYDKGLYDDAIADQTKAITLNPPWVADAYVYRGKAFRHKKDLITALADLDQAVKLKPDSTSALANRAFVYKDKKQFDLALADATRVITLLPADSGAYLDRGDIFKEKGDLSLALADYDQAAKLDPKSTTPFYRRIAVFKEQKDNTAVVAEYTKVIALTPLTGYHDRGHFYWNTGKLDLAAADFGESIKLSPKGWVYYWDRAEVLRLAKKFTEARADYDQMVQLQPTDATSYVYRGISFVLTGETALAETDFSKAVELKPDEALTLVGQGYLFTTRGDFVTAAAKFDAALAKSANYSYALIGRARLFEKQKKTAEAIVDLKKLLEVEPTGYQAYEAKIDLERLQKPTAKSPAKRPVKKRG